MSRPESAPSPVAGRPSVPVTVHPELERAHGAAHSVFSAMFEASLDGFMTFRPSRDGNGRVIDFVWTALNPAAEAITGCTPDQLLGERLAERWPFDEVRELVARYAQVFETGEPLTVEFCSPYTDGGPSWFNIECLRHHDGIDDGLVVICRDVTAQHRQAELLDEIESQRRELERLALTDPLTGLANRLLLDTRLTHAIRRLARHDRSLVVMFLDVDHLKHVNDTFGHRVGDAVLSELARRLEVSARPYDIVARVGGDEFVVVCEDVQNPEIPRIAHRLLDACTGSFDFEGQRLILSASLGVTVAIDPDCDVDDLIADADAAMYRAKALGGDRIELPELVAGAEVDDRYAIEQALPDAMERNQFDVVFQPILRAHDLGVVAADVRARWDHPEHGRLEHGDLTAAAHSRGLVESFHTWLLERAINELARRRDVDEQSVMLVVDVDGEIVADDAFRRWLADALAARGVPVHSLCIGLDEAFFTGDVGAAFASIEALSEIGVLVERIGVGVRSAPVQHMQSFPMAFVRIAPELVATLGSGGDDIIAAIVEIGHARQRALVASGVDTVEQFEALRRSGIDLVQGPHFADDLTADQLAQFIDDRRSG